MTVSVCVCVCVCVCLLSGVELEADDRQPGDVHDRGEHRWELTCCQGDDDDEYDDDSKLCVAGCCILIVFVVSSHELYYSVSQSVCQSVSSLSVCPSVDLTAVVVCDMQ